MKKFLIWVGWQLDRHPVIWVFFGVFLLCYGLSFLVFKISGIVSNPGAAAVCSLMGGLVLWVVLVAIIGLKYASRKTNWRIANDEAWEFAEENGLTDQAAFLHFFNRTKNDKNPTIVNEWIEDYKKWQETEKKLKQLEKDKEELPQRITETTYEREVLEKRLFT